MGPRMAHLTQRETAGSWLRRWCGLAALVCALVPVSTPSPPPRRIVLWAWERPEDLRFLAPHQADVSFLAATIELTQESFFVRPRHQPLYLPPGVRPRATVRIEMRQRALLTQVPAELRRQVVERLVATARDVDAAALQIDFDAGESEHEAYLALLEDLRAHLPASLPLSITALTSWCAPDMWLARAPVDEVVPQLFRMGPEAEAWQSRASRGLPRPCGQSVGLAVDEWQQPPPGVPTLYLFNPRPWTAATFTEALARLSP